MSKSKKTKEAKINTGLLLKSKALAGYQPDFAKVLLTADEYTVAEAKAILDTVIGKESK